MTKAEKDAAAAAEKLAADQAAAAKKAERNKCYKVLGPIKTLAGQHEAGDVIAADTFTKKDIAELIACGALLDLDDAMEAEA